MRKPSVRGAAVSVLFFLSLAFFEAVAMSQATKKGDEEWKAPARAARKKNPMPADAKSIARGEKVYVKECLACHGNTGKGDGPKAKEIEKHPGNLADPKMWNQTDGTLFWKTTEGRKPMPTYTKLLSDEERWDVVNYMRTLAPKPKKILKSKSGNK
ncbi:MAG: cytochrome c [Planctomycetes bacterium]|nr:cytochrome c [Planctomycetota bacterium]